MNNSGTPNQRAQVSENGKVRDMSWPELPAPLSAPVIDNHAHLDFADGNQHLSVPQHIRRAIASGVSGVITIGCDLESARWTYELLNETLPNITAADYLQLRTHLRGGVSIHPNDAVRHVVLKEDRRGNSLPDLDTALAEISTMLEHERMVTIGETGLDWFRTSKKKPEQRDAQISSFEKHIELAHQKSIPMQIHDRGAHQDVLEVLDRCKTPERTIFHCFSGDAEFAAACLERGAYLSFAGTVTFKNAQYLRDALAITPMEMILVETDAPFLTPEPYRGRPNSSYLIPHTLQVMAQVKAISVEALSKQIAQNTKEVYGFAAPELAQGV